MRGGVLDLVVARVERPLPPRRDDLQVRGQGFVGQLEADLIVPLAGAPVRHGVGALGQGDLDLRLGDDRPGERRAEQVLPLVDRVRAQRRETVLAHKLVLRVHDLGPVSAAGQRLLPHRRDVLGLSDVDDHGDDLRAIVLFEPWNDDGGVQTSGVGQHDFAR